MLDLRHATMADADLLFAWANDPAARAASQSTAPIARDDHDLWMKLYVAQGWPTHLVLIAEGDAGPVGVIRFDAERKDVMTYRVSISVAPEHRGKKFGFAMLDLAIRGQTETSFIAEIRRNNHASRRIFEKCGFEEMDRNIDFIRYRKAPLC